MRASLKRLLKRAISDRYVVLNRSKLAYAKDLLYTSNAADFLTEPKFAAAYHWVRRLDTTRITGAGIEWRIHVLCWAAYHASHLEGDFVHCGVNTGLFSRAVIEYVDFNRLGKTYYLLDTFSGMDPRYSSEYEMARNAELGYRNDGDIYRQVQRTFEAFNVKIIKGAVPESLNGVDTAKVAYLSIDMNCVVPEVAALEYFWEKMVSGGIIVLDDYGYPGCAEQRAAHDTFAKDKGVGVLSLPTCQGLIIRP